MNTYLNGFDRKEVTFNAGTGVEAGMSVTLLNKSTVSVGSVDANFAGVVSAVRDGMASVVLRGYVTVPYTGTTPDLGYNKLTADGNGGVQVSDKGRYILVADVDKVNHTCGIIL